MLLNHQQGLLPFISYNSFGKLVVNQSALAFLSTLPAPLSIVSIVGPPKSGKSFLLQQLLNPSHNNEHSPYQPTQALSLFFKPYLIYTEDGKISTTIFIDTPGIKCEDNDYQSKWMTLMLLISNCMLYNTQDQIENDLSNEFRKVMENLKFIKKTMNHNNNSIFFYLLRDHEKGSKEKISANWDLQKLLEEAKHKASREDIQLFRTMFPNRHCNYLSSPIDKNQQISPIFQEETIELRKKMSILPSMTLDGPILATLIGALVQSLNNGLSLENLFMQGSDCLARIECLERYRQELEELEVGAVQSVEDIEEKQSEIRNQLSQKYFQKMKSQKQIRALEEQIAAIEEQFNDSNERIPRYSHSHNYSYQTPPSSHLYVPTATPRKMQRVSLNISDGGQKFDYELNSFKSLSRNNKQYKMSDKSDKKISSKMIEYETKILRYELEVAASRHQIQYFQEEAMKSKNVMQSKQEQLQNAIQQQKNRERKLTLQLDELKEANMKLQTQKTLEVSEKDKLLMLSHDKIQYLERELKQLTEHYNYEKKEKQQKYKAKINEYAEQISELKLAHDQQILQLKDIYRKNTEKWPDNTTRHKTRNFFHDLSEQMENIDQLTEEKQKLTYQKSQLQSNLATVEEKLKGLQDRYKEQQELANKRAKDIEKHYEQLMASQLKQKEVMIQELKQKIASFSANSQKEEHRYENQLLLSNQQLSEVKQQLTLRLNELEQLKSTANTWQQEKKQYEATISENSQQISKLKEKLQNINASCQNLERQLGMKKRQSQDLEQKLEDCKFQKDFKIEQLNTSLQRQQTEKEQLRERKNQELVQLKMIHQNQKKQLEDKIQSLSSDLDHANQAKYELEQQRIRLVYSESEKESVLEHHEKIIANMKQQLAEIQQQLSNKDDQIIYLNKSISQLNQLLAQEETVEQVQPEYYEKERQQSQNRMGSVLQELAKSQTNYFILQQKYNNERANWMSQQQKYEQLLREQKEKNESYIAMQKQEGRQAEINQINQEKISFVLKKEKDQLEVQREKLLNQTIILSNKITFLETQSKLQAEQKNVKVAKLEKDLEQVKTERNNATEKEIQTLKRQLRMLHKERSVLGGNIDSLQKRLELERQKRESLSLLFQSKIRQYRQQNLQLCTLLQKYTSDFEQHETNRKMLEENLQTQMAIANKNGRPLRP